MIHLSLLLVHNSTAKVRKKTSIIANISHKVLQFSYFILIFASELFIKTKNRYGNNKKKNSRRSPRSLHGLHARERRRTKGCSVETQIKRHTIWKQSHHLSTERQKKSENGSIVQKLTSRSWKRKAGGCGKKSNR